jgi:hypothetical protein
VPVATFAKMAAGGNSSGWLKINHHDTEKAVASAVFGTGAAELA